MLLESIATKSLGQRWDLHSFGSRRNPPSKVWTLLLRLRWGTIQLLWDFLLRPQGTGDPGVKIKATGVRAITYPAVLEWGERLGAVDFFVHAPPLASMAKKFLATPECPLREQGAAPPVFPSGGLA